MRNKLISLFTSNSGKIKKLVSLLFIFGILKSLVYFAPLGINEILGSIDKFGAFEYSLNLGQTLTGIFSMGFAGAYAYFILKQEKTNLKPIFHLHFLILTTVLILVVLLRPTLLGNSIYGAIVLGIAFADQLFLSGVLKLKGKNNLSVVIDSGIYIVMAFIGILSFSGILIFSSELWFGAVLVSLILTSFFYHRPNIKQYKDVTKSEIIDLYKFGGLIVIAGPLLVLLTSNTRLFIEHFASMEEVGLYSFYFRLTSFVLIFYRVIGILLYRRMFLDDHEKLDKFYSFIISVLFLANILLFIVLPIVLNGQYRQFSDTFNDNKVLFMLCFFQVTFWINGALFEPILQRENVLKPFIVLLVLILVVFMSSLYFFHVRNLMSLELIVWLNTLFIFIMGLGQHVILRKRKISYRKTMYIQLIIGVIFLTTLFAI